MKSAFIRDKVIKQKLVDVLGQKMAEDICNEARFASISESDEKKQLEIFVEKTCSDPRFIGMWGTSQASKQKSEWLNLWK
jgi:hypothetical protein